MGSGKLLDVLGHGSEYSLGVMRDWQQRVLCALIPTVRLGKSRPTFQNDGATSVPGHWLLTGTIGPKRGSRGTSRVRSYLVDSQSENGNDLEQGDSQRKGITQDRTAVTLSRHCGIPP